MHSLLFCFSTASAVRCEVLLFDGGKGLIYWLASDFMCSTLRKLFAYHVRLLAWSFNVLLYFLSISMHLPCYIPIVYHLSSLALSAALHPTWVLTDSIYMCNS